MRQPTTMRGQKAAGPSFFTVDFYSSAPVIINQTHETSHLVKKENLKLKVTKLISHEVPYIEAIYLWIGCLFKSGFQDI